MAKKKNNNFSTLVGMKDADLRKQLTEHRDELRKLSGVFGAQGNDVKAMRNHRRSIAQIQTLLSDRAKAAQDA